MPERPSQRLARFHGWLVPAALLGLAPKCVLCLMAYAGLGATLGLGGSEICGAPMEGGNWTEPLPALVAACGTVGYFAWSRRRHTT